MKVLKTGKEERGPELALFSKVNSFGTEYGIKFVESGEILCAGLAYEEAGMEFKMITGEDVSFEEYHEMMS
jgi:hypothetical protein